ncbi:hypothetical protein ACFQPA_11680 [Halomarina halobia]|uniref:Ig-like domain-containing protein n=1 Tax=Halomarina halobia TaxID=3033386 RepID=A0ABD6A9K4_9EURY|nr:hypothetical protein [Halomarina sp. PSR21]
MRLSSRRTVVRRLGSAAALAVAGCVASPGDADPSPPASGDDFASERPDEYAAIVLVNADDVARTVRLRIADSEGESLFDADVTLDPGATKRYTETLPLAAAGMTDFAVAVAVDGSPPRREAIVLSGDGGRTVRVVVRDGRVVIGFGERA